MDRNGARLRVPHSVGPYTLRCVRLLTHHKLFLSYAAIILGVVLILIIGVDSAVRPPLLERATDELSREVALAVEIYDAQPGRHPDPLARYLHEVTGHRVTIIARDGGVIGDSEVASHELESLENHGSRDEVRLAMTVGRGTAVRRSASINADLLYAAALTDRGEVLRFAVNLYQIDQAVNAVRSQILVIGIIAVLIAAAMSAIVSVAATRPLRRMREIAAAMAGGDLTSRVRTFRRDEIGDLGRSLDTLSSELQKRLGQLERERAEMSALVDSMLEGVVAVSAEGIIRRANPAARRIFRVEGEIEGAASEVMTRRKEFLNIVRRALNGEQVSAIELSADRRQLIASAQPLPEGGAVLVFMDVTELRRLEDVRKDFIANASHELKTPLTAIKGYSETLLQQDLTDDVRLRFTRTLNANVERLQDIINDLLDLSRIESGGWSLDYEAIDLNEVADEAWQPIAAIAAGKGISVTMDIEEAARHVVADRAALRQILTNLFSNAVRYAPSSGSTSLTATYTGDEVHLQVRDTGSGIPASQLNRIFERFYRVDPARSRVEGGTGLGLAIVRHLVNQHGGRTWAESTLGSGTTIHVVLPAQEAGSAADV